MAIVTVEKNVAFDVHHDTLFKLFPSGNQDPVAKTLPHLNVEILQGSGGPGTIKKITFNHPGSEMKYWKMREEETDKGSMSHNFTIIEGDPWMDSLEKITAEIKVEASPNGGSVLKKCIKFIPKPNCTLDHAKFTAETHRITEIYKDLLETQIVAN